MLVGCQEDWGMGCSNMSNECYGEYFLFWGGEGMLGLAGVLGVAGCRVAIVLCLNFSFL